MKEGREVAAVGYAVVAATSGRPTLRLTYPPTSPVADPGAVELNVALDPAPLPNGGVRWWGRCPLGSAAGACGRRVRLLYRPPGSPHFGCRGCHRLAYASSQRHDRRLDRLRRDPDARAHVLRDPARLGIPELALALRLLTREQQTHDYWLADRNRQVPGGPADRPAG